MNQTLLPGTKEKQIAVLLLMAGGLLLLMALWLPKEEGPPGWEPLNGQLAGTLAELEEPAPVEAAPGTATPPALQEAASQPVEETASVAAPGHEDPPPGASSASPASDGKIDINRATAELLDTLPGIGAAKAQAIISDREQYGFFRSAEEITRVKGIGAKMLEKMKDHIVALP
ncbi:helix-hairpin-helix domain-containing protein [Paenibacillus sp. 1P07SE]|uniref:ComEA family DNA-binding protein n=1 Tax=Paenibacillus sp. 1P07SE TaxID=3132209 RepID=UPI0039A685BE